MSLSRGAVIIPVHSHTHSMKKMNQFLPKIAHIITVIISPEQQGGGGSQDVCIAVWEAVCQAKHKVNWPMFQFMCSGTHTPHTLSFFRLKKSTVYSKLPPQTGQLISVGVDYTLL